MESYSLALYNLCSNIRVNCGEWINHCVAQSVTEADVMWLINCLKTSRDQVILSLMSLRAPSHVGSLSLFNSISNRLVRQRLLQMFIEAYDKLKVYQLVRLKTGFKLYKIQTTLIVFKLVWSIVKSYVKPKCEYVIMKRYSIILSKKMLYTVFSVTLAHSNANET